jgi:proteasome lid subunit RPN8/RPN11
VFRSLPQLELLFPHLKGIATASDRSDLEICGLIMAGGEVQYLENISETPRLNFKIRPESYVGAFMGDSPRITACFHSHVLGDERMSDLDRAMSHNSGVPYLIYSTISKRFSFFNPKCLEIIYFSIQECIIESGIKT